MVAMRSLPADTLLLREAVQLRSSEFFSKKNKRILRLSAGAIGSISMWPWGVTFAIPFDYELHCAWRSSNWAIGSRCLNFPLFSLSSLFLSVSQKQVLTQQKAEWRTKSYCSGILHLDKFPLYTKQLSGLWCIGCDDGSSTASAGTHFCFFYSMSMSSQCELEFGSRFGCHFLFDELTSEDSSYNMLLLLSTTAWALAYPSNAGAAFCIGAVCPYSCEAKHFECLKTATFGHLDPMELGIALHIVTVVFMGIKASGVPLVTLVEFTQLVP